MGYGVKLIVRGDYACFTRPEMKVERVSYDVPTPSACRGILESVYWKPEMRWVIDRIVVYEPIRFFCIRRNELQEKIPLSAAERMVKLNAAEELHPKDDASFYANAETISQRAATILRDVRYGIEAHFELTRDVADSDAECKKHYNIALRRMRAGECFHQPVLGCREFSCAFEYAEELPASELKGDVDLGFMLYDMNFKDQAGGEKESAVYPEFYRPHLINGVIDVKKHREELVC